MEHLPEHCTEVRAALPLYVGADLDVREMEAVGAHLSECASCAVLHDRALAARNVLVEGLRATVEGPAPSLWAGVQAAVQAGIRAGFQAADSDSDPHTASASRGGAGSLRALPSTLQASTLQASGVQASGHSEPRVRPLRRLWAGSAAAAAALVLCYGLATWSGGAGQPGPRGWVSPGVAGAVVTSGEAVAPTVAGETTAVVTPVAAEVGPSGLRHVGSAGQSLFREAVEVRADQGIYLIPRAPQDVPQLVGGVPGR